MKHVFLKFTFLICFSCSCCLLNAQLLNDFTATGLFNEQELVLDNSWQNVNVVINAPLQFNAKGKYHIVFFALPNGNSIEWTKGKKLIAGEDWHFDIQHIAAQTRFVRDTDKKNNYIVVYLFATQKSWPAWKRSTTGALNIIQHIVDSITNIFKKYNPSIILNGHSGGGSFIFGYIDGVKEILPVVEKIAFLDSDYGYEDTLHKNKLIQWLQKNDKAKLLVLAYNDSLVTYNGKPLVSPTGGTWYRSRLMQRGLAGTFNFTTSEDTTFIIHQALKSRLKMILKQNPRGLIYHTEQVAKNGFILSLLFDTKFDKKKYFEYFSTPVYSKFINE